MRNSSKDLFKDTQVNTEQEEVIDNLEQVKIDDDYIQNNQTQIVPMSSVKILNSNKEWSPYFNAQQNPSKFIRILYTWYQFRDKITRPFTPKVPYFRKSIGQFILYVLVIASILPITYYPLFSKQASKFSEGFVEGKVAKWPSTLFLTLTFVFATRNSFIGFLTGIPYEDQIKMHKFFSYIAIITGWMHGIDEIVDSTIPFNASNMWSGFTLGSVMVALVIEGIIFKWFQKQFEIFLILHWIMLITVLVFSVLHYSGIATYIGGGFLLIDLLIRFIMIMKFGKQTKECYLRKVNEKTAEIYFLNLKRNFVFDAGQYLFISIPQISEFEWHPFTIQTCPYEQRVSLYIKGIGGFTNKLIKLSEKQNEIKIRINGPYGQPQLDIQSNTYEYFVFFSGGIGITPMQSIAKSLLFEHKAGRPLKRIIFCWTGRDLDFFDKIYRFSEEEDKQNVLKMNLNVTTKDIDNSLINAYEEHIKHKLQFGRLHIEQIIKDAQIEAQGMGLKKIAVLSCGPHSMMKSISKFSEKRTSKYKKVRVDYHRETFSFLTELL